MSTASPPLPSCVRPSNRRTSRITARSGGGTPWLRLLLAAAGVLGLGVLTGVVELPSLGDALAGLSDALGAWTYLVVPALAFLETAAFLGLALPGETAVLVGGVVAERGEVSLALLVAAVWGASVAGDLVSFLLGRRLGGEFLRRHAGRFGVEVAHIERIERLYARHGGKTIVFGRFVGVLRAFTPFLAGASGMPLRRFALFSLTAAFVWATLFTVLGYLFSSSIDAAGSVVTQITVAVMVLVGLILGVRRHRARAAGRLARAAAGSSPSSLSTEGHAP